jgi:hypothetical protein
MPAAAILMSTSPGPGEGLGTSVTANSRVRTSNRPASIVWVM